MHAIERAALGERITTAARAAGFDRAGIARLEATRESRLFREWIARGHHGEMAWLARNIEKRVDPSTLFEGARTALVVALVYDQPTPTGAPATNGALATSTPGQPTRSAGPASDDGSAVVARSEPQANEDHQARARTSNPAVGPGATPGPTSDPHPIPDSPPARIAKYARGTDYHDVMLDRLRSVGDTLEALAGHAVRWRAYVDTGPILERVLAAEAGLGWTGKNTLLIDPELGSYLFLGVLIMDLDLPAGAREPDHCGTCRACLDACPTDAFPEPYVLDATRCLSYTTIELRGSIPAALRAPQRDLAFGCDICQDVCPWNRRTRREVPPDRGGLRAALAPRAAWVAPTLAWLLDLDEEAWRAATRGTALRRTKYRGLLRNALIAAGNTRDASLVPRLQRFAAGDDAVLAEHARWALTRLAGAAG